MFGYPEHIITEPLSPKVLVKLIYEKCLPFDPVEAVLQQEVRGYAAGGKGLYIRREGVMYRRQ